LGQYVYEMTQAKVEALKSGGAVLPPPAQTQRDSDDEADIKAEVDEEDDYETELA